MARYTVSEPRDVINIIAEQREQQGYTMRELAAATGLAHPTLCNAVNRGDCKISTAIAYLDALGMRLVVVRERGH